MITTAQFQEEYLKVFAKESTTKLAEEILELTKTDNKQELLAKIDQLRQMVFEEMI